MPGLVSVGPPPSDGLGQFCPDSGTSPSEIPRDSIASSPETAMALHLLAEMYCILGRPDEAVSLLEGYIEDESGPDPVAKFSLYMQLGDTYLSLGQVEKSISCYESGLKIQIEALGSSNPLVADTCRYLAEAHLQAMQFDEAEIFCRMMLDIYQKHRGPGSLEEAADHRLLALICEAKGDYKSALEHLVLARNAMATNALNSEVANVDVGIGNIYSSLGRFDEALSSYHEALTVFKSTREDNNPSVASVFIRLADVCSKTGKLKESELFCENALRVYVESEVSVVMSEEIARALVEISSIYEALNKTEAALKLLQKAMKLLGGSPGHFNTVAGIEVQMGVMFNIIGRYDDAQSSFESAILKLRVCGASKSAFFGIVLNQMGLACVRTQRISEATEFFEEALTVLEQEFGPCHLETIGVYSNLAATYDALGRVDEAIELLEYIVKIREEKFGTANPDSDEEMRRLAQLLKEAGRTRRIKQKSLEDLSEFQFSRDERMNGETNIHVALNGKQKKRLIYSFPTEPHSTVQS